MAIEARQLHCVQGALLTMYGMTRGLLLMPYSLQMFSFRFFFLLLLLYSFHFPDLSSIEQIFIGRKDFTKKSQSNLLFMIILLFTF